MIVPVFPMVIPAIMNKPIQIICAPNHKVPAAKLNQEKCRGKLKEVEDVFASRRSKETS